MTTLYPLSPSSSYPHNSSKIRNKIRSPPPTIKSQTSSYPDLPSDPKRWTSSHVSTYLTHCLRLYPSAIVSDLSKHVKEDSTLTGRKFLRLKEDQLRQMNFNEKWIKLIMVGVKVLRREHLKDKILLNGVSNEEPEEMMKIIQDSSEESGEERYSSSSRKSSFERNSSNTSSFSSSSNYNDNDLKNFFIPTTFSNLTSDDKEFIVQEFNKLKEFLKSDIENENHDKKKFNELNRFIEKALLNIDMNKEKNHDNNNNNNNNDNNDNNDDGGSKIVEVGNKENENENSKSSLISLILFNWLNNKWTNNNNKIFESGFVRGVMIGGVAVWMYMRYYKW